MIKEEDSSIIEFLAYFIIFRCFMIAIELAYWFILRYTQFLIYYVIQVVICCSKKKDTHDSILTEESNLENVKFEAILPSSSVRVDDNKFKKH